MRHFSFHYFEYIVEMCPLLTFDCEQLKLIRVVLALCQHDVILN